MRHGYSAARWERTDRLVWDIDPAGWRGFRAGNLYDAIIARRLSREVLNFGFAGNGHEDIGVAKLLIRQNIARNSQPAGHR